MSHSHRDRESYRSPLPTWQQVAIRARQMKVANSFAQLLISVEREDEGISRLDERPRPEAHIALVPIAETSPALSPVTVAQADGVREMGVARATHLVDAAHEAGPEDQAPQVVSQPNVEVDIEEYFRSQQAYAPGQEPPNAAAA